MKTCVYCGNPAKTRDHVPPKSFYIEPLPVNLITVPCCYNCNHNFSTIEDYARTVLSSAREEVASAELAVELWHQKVERSLKRNIKLAEEIYYSFRPFGSDRLAFKIDREKIDLFIIKIIKGLYFYHFKKPLDNSYKVIVKLFPGTDRIPIQFPQEFVDMLYQIPIESIGNGVIRYRRMHAIEDEYFTCWIVSFFNSDYNTFLIWTKNID
ncbi:MULTISPECIES: hypothetical protein [unclassified Paenibacillus]|uniref:hypothetical protein n=1 Tax=unclassified Paenibacillus TaxID=185978 RepID=UPI003635458A